MSGLVLSCPETTVGRPNGAEDFSHEPPTVSLAGSYYFFSGPKRSYGVVHKEISSTTKLDFDHTHGDRNSEYIILGPSLRFFRCSRNWKGYVAAQNNSDFEDYEDVTDLFTENDVERPPFLYLGPNKTFYTRVADGTEKWKLSNEITCNGLQVTSNAVRSAVESLWLGVEGAWVAQYRDTRFRFDLKGQYKSLEKVMRKKKDEEVSINALALNVTDGRSYACVFNDGTVVYEAGRARFDGKEFEYWCEQNFRFTQRLTYA
ncbi:Ff.00g105710.m01.CDS01 [Fusarium sp. VM40]|nr:Ff.00g105710.m01.CDS01 [Fusarium sp. VM40]